MEDLAQQLETAFTSPDYHPPHLPEVALDIVRLAHDLDADIGRFVQLLEKDPILAGQVLKQARSPYFSPAAASAPRTLREAIVRLGLLTLQNIVIEAALNLRVFRTEGYTEAMQRISRHSSATAYFARIVSQYTTFPSEFAFLCGLLHDVGSAGMLIVLGDWWKDRAAPPIDVLWPTLDGLHARMSSLMTRLWTLPPEVQLAVENHHHVEVEQFDHPLACIVCVAEDLANQLGWSVQVPPDDGALTIDVTHERWLKQAHETLGIGEAEQEQIRQEAEEAVQQLIWLY